MKTKGRLVRLMGMDTLKDVDELMGRELDAAVHAEVMGGWPEYDVSLLNNLVKNVPPPPYSTDIAAAWEVVEKLNTEWQSVAVIRSSDGWRCVQGTDFLTAFEIDGYRGAEGAGETAQLAICRAALKAVRG